MSIFTNSARVKYTGITPGADGNTYVLFSTTGTSTIPGAAPTTQNPTNGTDYGANFASHSGVHKLTLNIKCNNAFTLNLYDSDNRGANWRQVTTEAVAAPAATGYVPREYLVEAMADFKLELVNGGSAQSPFVVDMSLSDQRSIA